MTGYRGVVVAQGIAVFVLNGGLTQEAARAPATNTPAISENHEYRRMTSLLVTSPGSSSIWSLSTYQLRNKHEILDGDL